MNIQQEIYTVLKGAGINNGDHIFVHSSYKSFGKLNHNGPDNIIKGLQLTVGDKGTILFPTLSYLYVNVNNPLFDVKMTKSCVGFLPEYFRKNYSEKRSLNPTHSVAGIGRDINYFLDDHIKDSTPLGENSPYRKLKEKKGKIIMFGCGLRPNTSMHAIEELVKPKYLFDGMIDYKVITEENKIIYKKIKKHGFKGYKQRYDRILNIMPKGSIIKTKVLNSETYVINCEVLWEKVEKKLRENQFYFVDKIENK